jgi:hypothetical protein
MKISHLLLGALLLAGCRKQVEIALTPPEFYENANRAVSPSEVRYPAETFRLGEARFIHGHLVATHESVGSAFTLTSICELLDSSITTLATATDTVEFTGGSVKTEWDVTFGQETPGQWRAGSYRVACKVGSAGTSASFNVVP